MINIGYLFLMFLMTCVCQIDLFCEEYSESTIPCAQSTLMDIESVKITIDIPKKEIGPAEPILATLSAQNIHNVTFQIGLSDSLLDRFQILVSRNGVKVPETEYLKNLHDISAKIQKLVVSSGNMIEWTPGMIIQNHRLINRYHDMSMEGEYVISATFSYFDFSRFQICKVNSNEIPVAISDKFSSYSHSYHGTQVIKQIEKSE